MNLLKDGFTASVLLFVSGLALIFAFAWPVEAGLKVLALFGAGLFAYLLTGQIFIIQAHVQGEIDRSFNQIQTAQTIIDSPRALAALTDGSRMISYQDGSENIEKLVPTYVSGASVGGARSTPQPVVQPRPEPVASAVMVELPGGQQVSKIDLGAFVNGLDDKGHTRAKWLGVRLPSGKTVDIAYFQLLIQAVRVSGEFPKYGQGIKANRTLTTNEIKSRLHLES